MSEILYKKDLHVGDNVTQVLTVKPWLGNNRFDIREWQSGYPTKKGVSLPTLRWVALAFATDLVDQAIKDVTGQKDVDFEYHLGKNVYVSVKSPYRLVDIRQRFVDAEGVLRPTKRGLKLKLQTWTSLKAAIQEIKEAVPETSVILPCFLDDDHQNQQGYINCPECNPNGYNTGFDAAIGYNTGYDTVQ